MHGSWVVLATIPKAYWASALATPIWVVLDARIMVERRWSGWAGAGIGLVSGALCAACGAIVALLLWALLPTRELARDNYEYRARENPLGPHLGPTPHGFVGPRPSASGPPPAGWYPDPMQRFSRRFFDGQQWTEHVTDDGPYGTQVDYLPQGPRY